MDRAATTSVVAASDRLVRVALQRLGGGSGAANASEGPLLQLERLYTTVLDDRQLIEAAQLYTTATTAVAQIAADRDRLAQYDALLRQVDSTLASAWQQSSDGDGGGGGDTDTLQSVVYALPAASLALALAALGERPFDSRTVSSSLLWKVNARNALLARMHQLLASHSGDTTQQSVPPLGERPTDSAAQVPSALTDHSASAVLEHFLAASSSSRRGRDTLAIGDLVRLLYTAERTPSVDLERALSRLFDSAAANADKSTTQQPQPRWFELFITATRSRGVDTRIVQPFALRRYVGVQLLPTLYFDVYTAPVRRRETLLALVRAVVVTQHIAEHSSGGGATFLPPPPFTCPVSVEQRVYDWTVARIDGEHCFVVLCEALMASGGNMAAASSSTASSARQEKPARTLMIADASPASGSPPTWYERVAYTQLVMHMQALYSELGVAVSALDPQADVYVQSVRTTTTTTSGAGNALCIRLLSSSSSSSSSSASVLRILTAQSSATIPLVRIALHAFAEATWPASFYSASSTPQRQALSPLMWLRRMYVYAPHWPSIRLASDAAAVVASDTTLDLLAHWLCNDQPPPPLSSDRWWTDAYTRIIDECARSIATDDDDEHSSSSSSSATLISLEAAALGGGGAIDSLLPSPPPPLLDWTVFTSGDLSRVKMLQRSIGARLDKHSRCRRCGGALSAQHVANAYASTTAAVAATAASPHELLQCCQSRRNGGGSSSSSTHPETGSAPTMLLA